ncbi:MAG: NUDIX domain-containing protein [Candidatus Moraniibacteriota bacterium]
MLTEKSKLKAGKDYIGVGGGILIFNDKKEVLLARRKGTRNEDGLWSKPGGGVDYGEKVEAALKREIKEEVGIVVDIWGYLPHTDHIIKKDKQHWVAFNYLAKIKSGVPKNREPEKCDGVEWFSLERLPRKLNQTTRETIKNYLAGKYIKLK